MVLLKYSEMFHNTNFTSPESVCGVHSRLRTFNDIKVGEEQCGLQKRNSCIDKYSLTNFRFNCQTNYIVEETVM